MYNQKKGQKFATGNSFYDKENLIQRESPSEKKKDKRTEQHPERKRQSRMEKYKWQSMSTLKCKSSRGHVNTNLGALLKKQC